jgi:hypothetical protein
MTCNKIMISSCYYYYYYYYYYYLFIYLAGCTMFPSSCARFTIMLSFSSNCFYLSNLLPVYYYYYYYY